MQSVDWEITDRSEKRIEVTVDLPTGETYAHVIPVTHFRGMDADAAQDHLEEIIIRSAQKRLDPVEIPDLPDQGSADLESHRRGPPS